LLNASDEAKVEAWFAMQAVADMVGPRSVLGVLGISWSPPGKGGKSGTYRLVATCQNGRVQQNIAAPPTLEEARGDRLLLAIERLEHECSELGGRKRPPRPRGTGRALVEATSASERGREWVSRVSPRTAENTLLSMVRVADAYGIEGINPLAPLDSHLAFVPFENRAELVREFSSPASAKCKAMSLRAGADNLPPLRESARVRPTPARVSALVARSGVKNPAIARTVLSGLMNNEATETSLRRLVRESMLMIEEIEQAKRAA
jgi:hypothetical protein